MNIFFKISRITFLSIVVLLWIVSFFTVQNSLATVILTIIFMAIFVGWLYSAGYLLFLKANGKVKLSLTKFRVAALYIVVYTAFFCWFATSVFPDNPSTLKGIFPFHILAMVAIVYVGRFTAMALKTVEMKRQAGFSDYSEVLFSLWLIPVGIWRIQPRIQRALNIEPII
ncbi:MAG TPA: hypothetical protein VEC36_00625 [Patescibacteria group bacterium]|nr:hypothetical protein [Patescibacteria group bacterium]